MRTSTYKRLIKNSIKVNYINKCNVRIDITVDQLGKCC